MNGGVDRNLRLPQRILEKRKTLDLDLTPAHLLHHSLDEIVHDLLNSGERFNIVVRNLDSEFFFRRHRDLHSVQAICAQIVLNAGVVRYLLFIDSDLLHENGNDLSSNFVCVHFVPPFAPTIQDAWHQRQNFGR